VRRWFPQISMLLIVKSLTVSRLFSPIAVLSASFSFLFSSFRSRAAIQIEILALRHQLNVLNRSAKRPRLSAMDRWFWAWLYATWADWRTALVFVKPETVVGWHRKGFRLFWTWKSRRDRRRRSTVDNETRQLVRRMSRENPLGAAPKIHGELLELGIEISESSLSKYLIRRKGPPSQIWNHFWRATSRAWFQLISSLCPQSVSRLYIFLVLAHDPGYLAHEDCRCEVTVMSGLRVRGRHMDRTTCFRAFANFVRCD
jgi:hypothetical protein